MEGEIDPMADLGFVNDKMIVMEPQGSITPSLPAKDLCARFIPQGEKLYELLHAYDMITSLVLNTGSGDGCVTKYAAPFLKAFGATDYLVSDFFAKNIPISANAADFLRYTNDIMPVYLNSCMYEQAADAICGRTGEPIDRMISVCLPLDETEMPPGEARGLRKMADIILNLKVPEGPFYGTAPLGLSREEVQVVSSLDKIFKGGLSGTASDRLMENVGSVGVSEKTYGLLDIRKTVQTDLDGTMYIGGEPNDCQALEMVRDGGGLALSFNGSDVCVGQSDVAVIDDSLLALTYLSAVFFNTGSQSVIDLAENWSRETIMEQDCPDPNLRDVLLRTYPDRLPGVYRICEENADKIARSSAEVRRSLEVKNRKKMFSSLPPKIRGHR